MVSWTHNYLTHRLWQRTTTNDSLCKALLWRLCCANVDIPSFRLNLFPCSTVCLGYFSKNRFFAAQDDDSAAQDGNDSADLPLSSDPENDQRGSIERETPPNSNPPLISVGQSGPKKRLFGTPFEKLAKYAFANSKRRKSDHAEQELAPTQVTRSTRKNPFLKSSQQTALSQQAMLQPEKCDVGSVDSGRETLDDSYTSNSQNVDPSTLADNDNDVLDTQCAGSQSILDSSSHVPDSGCGTSDSQGARPSWCSTIGEDSSSEVTLGGPREDSGCFTSTLIKEEEDEEFLYQGLAQGSAPSSSSPVKRRSWHFGSKKKSPVSLIL